MRALLLIAMGVYAMAGFALWRQATSVGTEAAPDFVRS